MGNSHSCETKVVKKDREKIVAVGFDHLRFSEECFYVSRMEMLVPLPKGNKLLGILKPGSPAPQASVLIVSCISF